MTPVIKSYLTDKGYANATNCQQIFGGHGYIEEQGMSQFSAMRASPHDL